MKSHKRETPDFIISRVSPEWQKEIEEIAKLAAIGGYFVISDEDRKKLIQELEEHYERND